MNTVAARIGSQPDRAFFAPILIGGALAAAIDLVYAFAFYGAIGIAPTRILQSIASGFFGMASFDGGLATAAIGLVAHFSILIAAAAIYLAASRRIAMLIRHALLCGLVFGAAIYATMHVVVVPLSAAPHFKSTLTQSLTDFAVHVALLGPAIALSVRHFSRRAAR